MKHIFYIILILISTILSFLYGRYDYYKDIDGKIYPYNIKEHLNKERAYANALFEGLHWYMRDDTTHWNNVFKKTIEYQKIDSINQGDWEDFYAPNWQ